jgi:hypothetical protein
LNGVPVLVAPTLGSVNLGATDAAAETPVVVRASLFEVVVAASVAAVVGAVVQKLIRSSK